MQRFKLTELHVLFISHHQTKLVDTCYKDNENVE